MDQMLEEGRPGQQVLGIVAGLHHLRDQLEVGNGASQRVGQQLNHSCQSMQKW